jgi:MOSC domain-containing protein YiiM
MAAHTTADELRDGLGEIGTSPADRGVVELVARRPAQGEREVLEEAALDVEEGLVGDDWRARGSRHTEDGAAHPDMQIALMSSRVIALLAGSPERWPLAGDQLYVDLDLSRENLPAGTRLAVGTAVLEVTEIPHTGCAKFTERFGPAAIRFVNSREGRALRLRGVYARVIEPGTVRPGDAISKIGSGAPGSSP